MVLLGVGPRHRCTIDQTNRSPSPCPCRHCRRCPCLPGATHQRGSHASWRALARSANRQWLTRCRRAVLRPVDVPRFLDHVLADPPAFTVWAMNIANVSVGSSRRSRWPATEIRPGPGSRRPSVDRTMYGDRFCGLDATRGVKPPARMDRRQDSVANARHAPASTALDENFNVCRTAAAVRMAVSPCRR